MEKNEELDPIEEIARERRERISAYYSETYNTREFQDGLKYLSSICNDYIIGLKYVSLMGMRFDAQDKSLLLAYQDLLTESLLMALEASLQGIRNVCRRELRYVLEHSVKLLSLDQNQINVPLSEKAALLNDRGKRFEDYVSDLKLFDEFSAKENFKNEILSLYSYLSTITHPSHDSLQEVERLSKKGVYTSMESVSALNTLAKNFFNVLDVSLVLVFHSIGLGLAGDVFVQCLDDEKKWKFHKGKFVKELSKCFDYKAERQNQS